MKETSKGDAKVVDSSADVSSSFVGATKSSLLRYMKKGEGKKKIDRILEKKEKEWHLLETLEADEVIEGMMQEQGLPSTFGEIVEEINSGAAQVEVSRATYACVEEFAEVHTKYKTVAKKVRPAAVPLPFEAKDVLERAKQEPSLRDRSKIGHKFTDETLKRLQIGGDGLLTKFEEEAFKAMIARHGKAFSFSIEEIGCVDPQEVTPMVIFTVPHVPWDLKPIPVPRALLPKLVELLKEKLDAKILERSNAPYSNRWFTVRKKNGNLRFIQDMQPPNQVTVRNVGTGPLVDEFAEEFAGRAIYSIGDLYSGYDQFQLAQDSRDITAMRTPLGLVRMCTLPMGATNSVAHMQNAMNRILQPFVPEKTRPFLDDIPIKGCAYEQRDESLRTDGLRHFVWEHMKDVEAILQRLIEVGLTLSGEKSSFGLKEIMVVGQICGAFGRVPSRAKVDAINLIMDCRNASEVRRFLGACIFFRIWIPHFAHVADPLYGLLRKNAKFVWTDVHTAAMQQMKKALLSPPVLRPLRYDGSPIIITVDSSPFAAGWAVGQDDEEGNRFAARYGAKIFTERQRLYAQVKRELWGAKIALKQDRDHLIGAYVRLETDCLPLLGMIANCDTPDIAMLRWIAFIRMFNPELVHIAGKDNPVADMLSRARYAGSQEELEAKVSMHANVEEKLEKLEFFEERYTGELLQIGRYLASLEKDPTWSEEAYSKIRKKSYHFMVREGLLWRHSKTKSGMLLRVVGKEEERRQVLQNLHDFEVAEHKGRDATYEKVRQLYWWPGMYVDVSTYVETCKVCQVYSKVKHRDGLNPTYPLALHYQWAVDLVAMPNGVRGAKFLVLAIEDLSSYSEGRALTSNKTEGVCRFIMEDILARYGCFDRMRADRGELNADEAIEFFKKYHIKLKLTAAYNPEGNGKSERGHQSIVSALVKACKGRISLWPNYLPLALMASRLTCSSVTGYAPAELVNGQLPLMPVEEDLSSWRTIEWKDGVSKEELLQRRIEQFDQTPEKVAIALAKMKQRRLASKTRFDKTHRLRPQPIQEGDWVLISEGGLEKNYKTANKFARRWRGPFVVVTCHSNSTYTIRELDEAIHRVPYAGKRVKLFKRRISFEGEEALSFDDEEEEDFSADDLD